MQVIQYRRALHRIPELDRDLPETLSYLRGCDGHNVLNRHKERLV